MQLLIRWEGHEPTEDTWEDVDEFKKAFPNYNLEEEVLFDGKSNVTTLKDNGAGRFGKGAREKIPSSKHPARDFIAYRGPTGRNG